jgi:dihydrodiol dehydrogenase / D-xylose 1-dehydrogenase (NADP)
LFARSDSFFYQRKLGGGASWLVGPYPIAAVLLFLGGGSDEKSKSDNGNSGSNTYLPEKILVSGQLDKMTGVDLQAAISLQFAATGDVSPALDPNNTMESTPKLPGAGVATISYGMLGESEEITTVVGTKGRLTIHTPCHCPTRLTVRLKGHGRGNAAAITHYEFPLPVETPEQLAATGEYEYPNSVGFAYEAAAVARCIAAGRPCCPQFTLEETMIVQHILKQVREQLGVKDVDAN